MKRKFLMLGVAMMAGLPPAVFAKTSQKESTERLYASWDSTYLPHYGSEGVARPLMEHLNVTPTANADPNKWQLEFGLPRADLMGGEDLAMGRGARAGVSLKLGF